MFVLLCYFLMTYAGIGVTHAVPGHLRTVSGRGDCRHHFLSRHPEHRRGNQRRAQFRPAAALHQLRGTNLVFTLAALGMLTSIQRFSTGAQPNCEITRKDERSIDVRL